MDAELKAKWVAALRSGKYRQAVGTLKDRDRHCCIGVLCDLLTPGRVWDTGYSGLDKHGLDQETRRHFASLNDEGKSFSEIADEIEETL